MGGATGSPVVSSPGAAGTSSVDRSAELVFSYDGFLPSIDPHKNSGGQHTPPMLAAYDRLIHLTPEGDFTPGLATEWEVADDGMSMDLTLRGGVRFHDGTPLDVVAVRKSLERASQLESGVPPPLPVCRRDLYPATAGGAGTRGAEWSNAISLTTGTSGRSELPAA